MYIVAGANGYIGKPLLDSLSKKVMATGTGSKGTDNLLSLRLEAPSDFDYELIQPLDVVFFTAAISAPDICRREYSRAWEVNVTGTSEFIRRVMLRGARVVFFSSDTVYGERSINFDDTANCQPSGEYAEMKHAVEKMFLDDSLFKVIRLSYVFSFEDKFTKYLVDCARRGEEAEIFQPFYRAVIHRDDAIEGAIALAQHWDDFPQNIINFGGPEVLDRSEFVETLQDTVLSNLRFRVTEPDAGFFRGRPRVIRMKSPILTSLLRRSAHTLREAAIIEFNFKKENRHD